MKSFRATHIVGTLAGLLVLGLSACGSEEPSPSSSSAPAPAPSAAATSTAATSTVPDDGAGIVVPEDLCTVVSAEDVSAVVAQAVAVGEAAEPGACIYQAGGTEDLVVSLGIVPEGEAGGFEGARSQLEETVGAASEPVTVLGNEGFVAMGTLNGGPFSSGAVALDGLLVIVTLGNGDPELHAEQMTQLLELTIGAL